VWHDKSLDELVIILTEEKRKMSDEFYNFKAAKLYAAKVLKKAAKVTLLASSSFDVQ
jgi:hypothetical protein